MTTAHIAVDPKRHGEGIGGRLLKHADDVARAYGRDEIRLYTHIAMTEKLVYFARPV